MTNPDRLSGLDSAFLHLERDGAHMHVASIMVFAGQAPSYDQFRRFLESRLDRVPRYRQRLAFVPLEQGRPVWVDDPHFNVRYHLRHARDWLVRMGDGTPESHTRAQNALNHLFSYTQEFWTPSAHETAACQSGMGMDTSTLQADWNAIVDQALEDATLSRPAAGGFVSTGKQSVHSEHLGFVLADMQSLARAHPTATW